MDEKRLHAEVTAQREELAALLAGLPEKAWDEPSLCEGWRVREVVAHMTMPFRYGGPRVLLELIRSGGRMNRMLDRCARRDTATVTAAELTASMRDNAAHPWKPPGGGYAGALTHEVVHGLDITVPLGLDLPMPGERLRVVLDGLAAPKALKYFGVDLDGVRLRADDLDWECGSGAAVTGSAADLVMVLGGRRLPAGRLRGELSGRFAAA